MSSLLIDCIIWILLFVGVGFGLIGLIGLLLFPDTRSRMYTSVRATLIGISTVALAVICYGLYALQASGGDLYSALLLHTIILVVVVGIGNYFVYVILLEKSHHPGILSPDNKPDEKKPNNRNKK